MPWLGNRFVPGSARPGYFWQEVGGGFREVPIPSFGPSITPAVPSTNQSAQQNNQAADLLQELYDELSGMGPQSVTQQSTKTTQQTRSPQLENNIQNYIAQLNQLSQGMTDAYGGVQNTFQDLISSVADAYRIRATDASNARQQSALASGLTPLEASTLGTEANMNILNQMFPQIAGLEQQRAQQDVLLQESLAELQQGNYLPFIQNVVAPYLQNVAGQTTTSRGQTTDPYKHYGLLGQLANQIASQDTQRQKLGQDSSQFQQNLAFQRQKLKSQESRFYAGLNAQNQRAQSARDTQLQINQNTIEGRREQAILEAALKGQLNQTQYQAALDKLEKAGQINIQETYGSGFQAGVSAAKQLYNK
jgi:hypothetical protein